MKTDLHVLWLRGLVKYVYEVIICNVERESVSRNPAERKIFACLHVNICWYSSGIVLKRREIERQGIVGVHTRVRAKI